MNISTKNYTLQILNSTFLIFALLLVILIFAQTYINLNKGISVDEGYYLQGYINEQQSNSGVSDFHNIVKNSLSFLPLENVSFMRRFYFGLTLLTLTLFSLSSYIFLRKKENILINWKNYFLSIFSAGALCFCYASPILYYDTIQSTLFLIIFSLIFLASTYPKTEKIFYSIIGFLILYTLTNYLPSGILLCFGILFWMIHYKQVNSSTVLFTIIGFFISLIIYHLRIHELNDLFSQIINSLKEAQSNNTKHSSSFLFQKAIIYWGEVILFIFISFTIIYFAFKKIKRNKKNGFQWIGVSLLYAIIFSFSFLYKKELCTTLLLFPAIILTADSFTKEKFPYKHIKKYIIPGFPVLFLFIIPFCGVFGTDQTIQHKSMYFMAFWSMGANWLIYKCIDRISTYNRLYLPYAFSILTAIIFSYYGYVIRYHNYYGMKGSNTEIHHNNNRFKNIKISPYQKQYIERIDSTLRANGFQAEDNILAFEVDLIPVFALHGIVPKNLLYSHIYMLNNKKNLPDEKVNYILVYKRAQNEFIEFVHENTNWNFPEDYVPLEMGKFTENMAESQSSTLFIAKEKINHSIK